MAFFFFFLGGWVVGRHSCVLAGTVLDWTVSLLLQSMGRIGVGFSWHAPRVNGSFVHRCVARVAPVVLYFQFCLLFDTVHCCNGLQLWCRCFNKCRSWWLNHHCFRLLRVSHGDGGSATPVHPQPRGCRDASHLHPPALEEDVQQTSGFLLRFLLPLSLFVLFPLRGFYRLYCALLSITTTTRGLFIRL